MSDMEEAVIGGRARWETIGVAVLAAVALFTPLVFNPYNGEAPFEPAKEMLVRGGAAIMLLVLVAAWLQNGRPDFPWRGRSVLFIAAVAFATAILLSTATSASPARSWFGTSAELGAWTALSFLLLGVAAALLLGEHSRRDCLLDVMLLAGVPAALYGLVQFCGLDPLAWRSDSISPMHSTLGRANFLGAFLAMLLPLALARTVARRSGAPALLVLFTLALYLTQTRAAWLGAVAGCTLVLVVAACTMQRRKLAIAAAAVPVAGLAFFVLMQRAPIIVPNGAQAGAAAQPAILGAAPSTLRDESSRRRWIIWRATAELLPSQWLLGYGYANFGAFFSRAYPTASLFSGRDSRVLDPHNLILYKLFTVGFLGTAAFFVLLGALTFGGWRWWTTYRNSEAALLLTGIGGALLAYLVHAQFTPATVAVDLHFWLLVGIAASVCAPSAHQQRLGTKSEF